MFARDFSREPLNLFSDHHLDLDHDVGVDVDVDEADADDEDEDSVSLDEARAVVPVGGGCCRKCASSDTFSEESAEDDDFLVRVEHANLNADPMWNSVCKVEEDGYDVDGGEKDQREMISQSDIHK